MDVPRNAPCPCGSGLKYKKCHGTTRVHDAILLTDNVRDFPMRDIRVEPLPA